MKRLIIKSLTLRNFRGEKERTTGFSPYETFISGRNGAGKSRHFDAFLWLMFGKDTEGRTDYEIKSKDRFGNTMKKVDVEVSAELDINGSTNELRRVLVEDYVKPRGQAEEVFKGNRTEVFWNDVPLKVSEYETRVAGIINITLFKMLTNPLYFPNLNWQDQREMVFQMAGTISDAELANKKPEYTSLMDKISGKSLAEYKTQLAARKKKLKEELQGIQPRIDQTQKLMPDRKDWAALESALLEEIANLERIDEALKSRAKSNQQHYDKISVLQKQNNDLRQERVALVNEAKLKQQQELFASGEGRRKLDSEISSLSNTIAYLESELKTVNQRIETTNKQIDQKRVEYQEESARKYDGSDNCAHCGQVIPEGKRANARNTFAEAKKVRLEQITAEGGAIKEGLAILSASATKLIASIEENGLKLQDLNKQIENLPITLLSKELEVEAIQGYKELSEKIDALSAEIESLSGQESNGETDDISRQKAEITARIDGIKTKLRDEGLIERYTQEINNLHEKSKELGQQIADCERDEFTMAQFTKDKISDVESRVNGMFELVKFELYKYTIEGNPIETCTPTLNGVPFGSLNTAGQVQAGLDIIKSLQKFHQAYFPIFNDHAESVNQYPDMDSQMIYLKVTEEEELTVSYENQMVL